LSKEIRGSVKAPAAGEESDEEQDDRQNPEDSHRGLVAERLAVPELGAVTGMARVRTEELGQGQSQGGDQQHAHEREEEAVSAFNRKEVDGILLQTAQNKSQLRGLNNSQVFSLPSYRAYGIFFNTDQKILKDRNVRLAINYAINREEILNKWIELINN
jgi:hypothetical protein